MCSTNGTCQIISLFKWLFYISKEILWAVTKLFNGSIGRFRIACWWHIHRFNLIWWNILKCIATTKLWDDITGIASIFYTIFQRNENHRKPNQWRKLIKCLARLIKIDAVVPFSLNERIFKGNYYSWMHDHGAIEIHCT